METDTESDEDMETEFMVFEVSEIDLEYEFDAPHWFDFTSEESPLESRVVELWFDTAQSNPPSLYAMNLLMREEVFGYKPEPLWKPEDEEVTVDVQDSDRDISEKQDVNETGNGMRSGAFTFIHGGTLNKDSNQSLHKGPTFSNRIQSDKLKCRSKSSTRPITRSSTLMKPTASQLAKQNNSRFHLQVDEMQSSKRQKLDGGLLRKVAETPQETNLVHKAFKKDLDKNSLHAKMKVTVPQDPDFATSRRANRMRHKSAATMDQDSTSLYRFKARRLNRRIFEAPSLPIRKNSTPKPPEFQEFRLKTSERAMQHSNSYHKGSNKPETTAVLDGVNREQRRLRAMNIPKDDDDDDVRKHLFKARPLIKKGFRVHSEKRVQADIPTEIFSKLSLSSEFQQSNGSHLNIHQPEQVVKGSKEDSLNSFQVGNEITSKLTVQQRGVVPETTGNGMFGVVNSNQRCN